MKKTKLLIYGAGAIGRGYIPWVFESNNYDYYYVDSNEALVKQLEENKKFTTYRIVNDKYETKIVEIQGCTLIGDEKELLLEADAVVTAVGPRNFLQLSSQLRGLTVPVLCCENDASLPADMRKLTGNKNVVFVIPDVITSNTASQDLLRKDPLAIITENGECFIDETLEPKLEGNCQYISTKELEKQWLAKLYIHNTPHCIAAYLGNMLDVKYLHESMANETIESIVSGAMQEMVLMLQHRVHLEIDFLNFYRDKELSRFQNPLLYDPIERVAREPFRKLAPKDRLIGAAQLCLTAGIVPYNVLTGIMAAFYFENEKDPDAHIRYLRNSMKPEDFLRIIFRLSENEALFTLLIQHWTSLTQKLEAIKNDK